MYCRSNYCTKVYDIGIAIIELYNEDFRKSTILFVKNIIKKGEVSSR
jgi:hypothetical protein